MAAPIIVQTPKGTNGGTIVAGAAVGLAAYWFIARPLIEKWQANNTLKKEQDSTITAGKKKLFDLNGKPIKAANIGSIASELNQALHPGWYKPTEQDRVVRVFKTTPFGYVGKLEAYYLDKYGENLKATMLDKLSDENFIKVKYDFR